MIIVAAEARNGSETRELGEIAQRLRELHTLVRSAIARQSLGK